MRGGRINVVSWGLRQVLVALTINKLLPAHLLPRYPGVRHGFVGCIAHACHGLKHQAGSKTWRGNQVSLPSLVRRASSSELMLFIVQAAALLRCTPMSSLNRPKKMAENGCLMHRIMISSFPLILSTERSVNN